MNEYTTDAEEEAFKKMFQWLTDWAGNQLTAEQFLNWVKEQPADQCMGFARKSHDFPPCRAIRALHHVPDWVCVQVAPSIGLSTRENVVWKVYFYSRSSYFESGWVVVDSELVNMFNKMDSLMKDTRYPQHITPAMFLPLVEG
jgi:hypothetical protein